MLFITTEDGGDLQCPFRLQMDDGCHAASMGILHVYTLVMVRLCHVVLIYRGWRRSAVLSQGYIRMIAKKNLVIAWAGHPCIWGPGVACS